MRLAKWVALAGTVTLLVLFVLLPLFVAWNLIHPARNETTLSPRDLGLPFESVALRSADGVALQSWFVPGNRTDAAILLVHGYQGSKASMLPQAEFLHRAGYPVLLLDLRNHGRSQEALTTFGLREWQDAVAAANELQARNFTRLGILGVSMGSSTTLHAAARDPRFAAVVSDVGFYSLRESAADAFRNIVGLPDAVFLPMTSWWGQVLGGASMDDIAPGREIGRISPRPVLIIHTDADKLTGAAAGHRLFEAAGEPKEFWAVPDAEHGRVHQKYTAEYEARVLGFFDRNLAPA
jgi:dipeptidyl aminopeptidase/acylaminoacyl peptidase